MELNQKGFSINDILGGEPMIVTDAKKDRDILKKEIEELKYINESIWA